MKVKWIFKFYKILILKLDFKAKNTQYVPKVLTINCKADILLNNLIWFSNENNVLKMIKYQPKSI